MKHKEDRAKGRGRKVGYGKGVYTEVWNGNLSWKLRSIHTQNLQIVSW